MNNIFILKYIDALYYTSKKISFKKLTVHFAIGEIESDFTNYIKIIFSKKNKKAENGLMLPLRTIIFNEDPFNKKFDYKFKKQEQIGVFWEDVVYFTNGKMPNKCTQMYSEGKFIMQKNGVLILKNPVTIMIKNKIRNHPNKPVSYVVIPEVMITDIQKYDK